MYAANLNPEKEWMTKYGHFLTRKQVQAIIDAVDENDDGEVDYNEFLVSLTQNTRLTLTT